MYSIRQDASQTTKGQDGDEGREDGVANKDSRGMLGLGSRVASLRVARASRLSPSQTPARDYPPPLTWPRRLPKKEGGLQGAS